MATSVEVILARVARVPPGFVTTYADLSPGAPRQAGRALSQGGPDTPWWRVVRSDGTWAKGEEQRRRLAAEEIPILGQRVVLAEAQMIPKLFTDAPSQWENACVDQRYRKPGWFTTHVFNRVVAWLTQMGVSVYGSRVLEVKGRKSGEWRQTPVNLLRFEGADYLVAPRGQTQWVKNLRAGGEGRLLLGKRIEPFSAVELANDEKAPVLRAYLKKWKVEVGVFFDGVGPASSDEDLRRIAPNHPVFRLSMRS